MSIQAHVTTFLDEFVALRHDLHAHPEIGFEEIRTSDIVANLLSGLGYKVHRGLAKTGVVGVLTGKAGGRTIGLRADMDALPMHEETGLAYASTVPGVFHGCGHDGHTTILLAAARYLAETRNFSGTAVLIFQPAEEGLGGARAMIADGLFEKFPCDEIYALHNMPDGPRGRVSVRTGPAMAAADFFDVRVKGRGGHAAFPHNVVDPVIAANAFMQAAQTIVSRNIDPLAPFVLSFTRMLSGSAHNIIADDVEISGTMRAFSNEARALARRRFEEIAAGIGAAFNVEITTDIRDIFSVLINTPACSTAIADAAAELFGEDAVHRDAPPLLASEDFADMLQHAPGAYIWLSQAPGPGVHNPSYRFDDEIIPLGAALLVRTLERRSTF